MHVGQYRICYCPLSHSKAKSFQGRILWIKIQDTHFLPFLILPEQGKMHTGEIPTTEGCVCGTCLVQKIWLPWLPVCIFGSNAEWQQQPPLAVPGVDDPAWKSKAAIIRLHQNRTVVFNSSSQQFAGHNFQIPPATVIWSDPHLHIFQRHLYIQFM